MKWQESDIFIDGYQHPLHSVGDPDLLKNRTLALLCSVKCPGSIILRTYDLMQDLRNENVTIISGFHSPMEKECLKILLRGTCGIVICYARSLPKHMPLEFKEPTNDGRLLLLSEYDDKHNRPTKEISTERNNLIASIADVLLVPYASPGGMVEEICGKAVAKGKSVLSFDYDLSSILAAIHIGDGDKP